MVEAAVMHRKIPLRVNPSKHPTIAVKIVGRIAVEEVCVVFRDGFLERALFDVKVRGAEGFDFFDQSLKASLLLVHLRHPSKESRAVGEVVVKPVVSGEV